MSNKPALRYFLLALLMILIGFAGFETWLILKNNDQLTEMQANQAALNHIRYGFFNQDRWKKEITLILTEEVTRAVSPASISETANIIISGKIRDFIDMVPSSLFLGFKGDVEQWLVSSGFITDISDVLSSFVTDIAGKVDLEGKLLRKVTEVIGFYKEASEEQLAIINRYQCADLSGCNTFLDEQARLLQEEENKMMALIAGLLILSVIICMVFNRLLSLPGFILLLLGSLVALVAGIFMPLITLDARIESIRLDLLSHPIEFTNQVVFFQSKSIVQIISTLLSQHDWMVVLVGVLILTFSVFTPLIKQFSSFLIRAGILKGAGFTRIIASLGKWSMADVFTVALFMAYLGMNGLIGSNFSQLERNETDAFINTANNTHFRPGLIFFTLYTIISIVSSYLLKKEQEVRDPLPEHVVH